MIQTAPAAHRRYLSSPAAATLHGKTQGFVPRLPPQNKAHATSKTKPIEHSCSHYYAFRSIPFINTSLRHHFPSSPPCVIASYSFVMYCCVMSSLTPPCAIAYYSFVMSCYVMSSLTPPCSHHFPSSPPCVIASYSFVMSCYVMSSFTPPCVIAYYVFVMYCYVMQKTHTTLHQCQVSQFYLSVTRKYCFPTSFDYTDTCFGGKLLPWCYMFCHRRPSKVSISKHG